MKKIVFFIVILFSFCINTYALSAPVDITKLDVRSLQDAVDNGYLTYEAITRLYLERIDVYDDKYNAMISINENAIDEAREKDKIYKENGRDSLLFGIPIIVKDNIDVEGLATTAGSKSLSDNYPNEDASIISKLKDSGAIILGKANMSEFAFMASSSVSSYGRVNNPYNTGYSSYGSSGGSAASVSLKYAPLAIGTDTNLSLRAPASANGVIGFRPTLNKLSNEGIIGYDITKDTPGPMSTNVYDNALLMAFLEGKDEDYYTKYLEDSSLDGKKIGVLKQFAYGDDSGIYGTGKTYSKLVDLFDSSIKLLEDNGAEIVYIDDFYNWEYSNLDDSTLGGWTMCYSFNKYIKNTSSKIKNFYELNYDDGHIYSLWGYLADCGRDIDDVKDMEEDKKEYREFVNKLFIDGEYDALVYPTTKNRLTKHGEDNFESAGYAIASQLGMPAVSVPLGYIDNLPYGIEFVSQKNNEGVLYEIINEYEKINNVYYLSDDAPNLYEIPDSVEKLKKLYEENKDKLVMYIIKGEKIKNYEDALDEVIAFFENYNDYEDVDTTAKELYDKYSSSLNNLGNVNFVFIIELGVVFILLFILFKLLKKFRKIRKKIKRLRSKRKK